VRPGEGGGGDGDRALPARALATFPGTAEFRELAELLLGPVCFAMPIASLAGTWLAPFEAKVLPLRLTSEEQASTTGRARSFSST